MFWVPTRASDSNPGVKALIQTNVGVAGRSGCAELEPVAVCPHLVDTQAQAGKTLALAKRDAGAHRGGVPDDGLKNRGAALPEPRDRLGRGGEPRVRGLQIVDHVLVHASPQ